jgi:hypothetical protein
MTKDDKKKILQFIVRTGMYISPVDDKNVISFIHGYQLGTIHKCDFTELVKQLLIRKHKIKWGSDGWPGQITRLANKKSLSWVVTFKRTALEIVTDSRNGGLDKALAEILKKRIVSLIEHIEASGHSWFNDSWREEWLSLCSVKSKWFKPIWTDKEWAIVKSIDKHVQAGDVFSKKGDHLPTQQLLKLKAQFDKSTSKKGA